MIAIGGPVIFIVIVIMLLLATRLVKSNSNGGRKVIKAAEVKEMLGRKDVVLVDVRSAGEYHSGHIKGAVLLPLPQVGVQAEKVLGSKDKTIIVYCQSGSRSRVASTVLQRQGYQTVYDLGGIYSWPYEIV